MKFAELAAHGNPRRKSQKYDLTRPTSFMFIHVPRSEMSPKLAIYGMHACIFYARQHIYAIARICYRPSVCPSVCPSDGCIIQKRLKLGL